MPEPDLVDVLLEVLEAGVQAQPDATAGGDEAGVPGTDRPDEPPASPTKRLPTPAEIGPVLAAALADCQAEFPTLGLDLEGFVRHLGRALAENRDPLARLRTAAMIDLYLAYGCAIGHQAAISEFGRRYAKTVEQAVCRAVGSDRGADDVLQELLGGHLVHGGQARIRAYRGRGPLGGFVRVAATRIALDVQRREHRLVNTEPASFSPLTDPQLDPELRYLRERYARVFDAAFDAAFAALEPRARTLLRLNLIEGLSIDDLARLYQVHRATAARWLVRAREAVRDHTRDWIITQVHVSESELNSLVQLVGSELDIQLEQRLE